MLSVLFASTQSQACISLVPRSCVQGDAWTETNGWHTPECIPRKSSEVPPGLRSKTVQLYGWNLCYVIWAENQLWLIFIAAVNEAIKLQRGTAEVPEVCTASEEALNNPFACVPLWKGKHTVWKAILLWDAYRGLASIWNLFFLIQCFEYGNSLRYQVS